MADLDDLLLDLMDRSTPATDDDYLVYADAASLHGDPRGELIVIQHALARHPLTDAQRTELLAREAELLAHEDLVGPRLAACFRDGDLPRATRWHNGFLHTVRLETCYWNRYGALADDVEPLDALDVVLSHPSAALLHHLVLSTDSSDGMSDIAPGSIASVFGYHELELLARHRPYTLRHLTLNDRWEQEPGDKPRYYDNSWFKIAGIGFLADLPDLEHLELIAGDFVDLELLDNPLKSLALRTGGLRPARLRSLLARSWPSIERLELWFGQPQYGGDCDVSDLAGILDGSRFPNLRWLGLMNAEFTDELCEVLGDAQILPQLEGLSLALGCLSHVGMRHLIGKAGAFTHLRELDVSWSLLDVPSQRALQNAFPAITIGTQRGDRPARYATVGE